MVSILFYERHSTDCFADPFNPRSGDPGGYRNITLKLKEKGYSLDFFDGVIHQYNKPINVLVIVVGRDSEKFDELEIKSILNFVEKGGRLFIVYDSKRGYLNNNINDIVKHFCVEFADDLVWDSDNNRIRESNDGWRKRIVIDKFNKKHPITSNIRKIWYWGCSVIIDKECENMKKSRIDILARASKTAYSGNPIVTMQVLPNGKVIYPISIEVLNRPYSRNSYPPVLVAYKNKRGGRVVIFGGRYTFNNDSIDLNRYGLLGFNHEDLFFNIIKWLSDNSNSILITSPNLVSKIKITFKKYWKYIIALLTVISAVSAIATLIRYLFWGA